MCGCGVLALRSDVALLGLGLGSVFAMVVETEGLVLSVTPDAVPCGWNTVGSSNRSGSSQFRGR